MQTDKIALKLNFFIFTSSLYFYDKFVNTCKNDFSVLCGVLWGALYGVLRCFMMRLRKLAVLSLQVLRFKTQLLYARDGVTSVSSERKPYIDAQIIY